jgi:HEAT repeat protein
VTDALVTELASCGPERQPLLLLAIADRDDAASYAALLNAAKAGPAPVRIVAINALERQGNALSLPVLLAVAATADAGVAQAALAALTRFPGSAVDAEVLARLPLFTGQARQVLIELAGRRHIVQALPAILDFTEDPDAGVRSAAIHVIGVLGDDQQAAALVDLMQHARGPKDSADLEAALIALSSRAGTRCVPHLLPLAQSADATLRIAALRVLASAGGPQALSAVTAAIDDGDPSVRDEAVRTLSTWPNNWPDDSSVAEPMLRLVRYSMKPSYQVLAMRGYLQYIQSDKHLSDEAKIEKVRDLLPLLKRPEEQRLAIGVISAVPTAGSLELLAALAGEPATGDDACAAILKLAGDKASPIPKEQRRQAAQTVAAKASLNATRSQAQQVLNNL